jgi:galactokinase
MNDSREAARRAFVDLTGYEPDGTWSAPGRANLIGEHTDYNGGFVLPFAIDRRTTVALARRDDGILRVASTFADEVVEVRLDELAALRASGGLRGWSAYVLGVAAVLGEGNADLDRVTGCDLLIDSDVPVGAGLSSSAALESSVAVALNEVWELGLDRPALARVGQRSENEVLGAPTGIMDQSASLLGRRDAAVFLDCRSLESEIVPLGLEAAGLHILVIDTGVQHDHATGGYRDRREACERGASTLGVATLRELSVDDLEAARSRLDDVTFRRVRHVVTENARVLETVRLLRESGPGAIGELLDASHRSLRNDFEVSVPELDLAVETAQSNGAIGARMTGGGFGGSAIALVPSASISRVVGSVADAFAEHGFGPPDVFSVTPSGGAGRDHNS